MQLLFAVPVVDILSYFGKRIDHRSYMYYSPFREESEPSMRVTVNRNDGTWVWADYGGVPEGGRHVDGGGVLEMVRRLAGVSTDAAAMGVLEEIGRSRGIEVIREESRVERKKVKDSGIVIDDVSGTFSRRSIRDYAVNVRCIPLPLLERYCRQVKYHSKADSSRFFTVIGFPNNAGGFAMRGSGENRKMNNVWGLTTLGPDGVLRKDASVASDKCALFEGFMDFLSYMAWRGAQEPGMDVCVLHSASNAVHAKGWVEAHGAVRCFFDNDDAGSRATELVASWCGGKDFKDGRSAYAGHKDINEAWKEAVAKRKGQSRSEDRQPSGAGIKI